MTSADVRTRLTAALALDLIGPAPGSAHANERIDRPPSRWYLTGFLAPWNAPVTQKKDDDPQEELELSQAGGSGDEDENPPEAHAARRGHFSSSMGLSVLVPKALTTLHVTVRWGDYTPLENEEAATGEWEREEREETITVALPKGRGSRRRRRSRTVAGWRSSRPCASCVTAQHCATCRRAPAPCRCSS